MKEHIEKKTCEYENLQKQSVQLKTAIQEKEIEIEGLKEDIANSKSQDECLKEKINAMEAKEADLEMELDQMKTRCVSNSSFYGTFCWFLIYAIGLMFFCNLKILNRLSRRKTDMASNPLLKLRLLEGHKIWKKSPTSFDKTAVFTQ